MPQTGINARALLESSLKDDISSGNGLLAVRIRVSKPQLIWYIFLDLPIRGAASTRWYGKSDARKGKYVLDAASLDRSVGYGRRRSSVSDNGLAAQFAE